MKFNLSKFDSIRSSNPRGSSAASYHLRRGGVEDNTFTLSESGKNLLIDNEWTAGLYNTDLGPIVILVATTHDNATLIRNRTRKDGSPMGRGKSIKSQALAALLDQCGMEDVEDIRLTQISETESGPVYQLTDWEEMPEVLEEDDEEEEEEVDIDSLVNID